MAIILKMVEPIILPWKIYETARSSTLLPNVGDIKIFNFCQVVEVVSQDCFDLACLHYL